MKKISTLLTIMLLGLSLCILSSCGSSQKVKEESTPSPSKSRFVELYPASVNTVEGEKWGYIDKNGNFTIKATFSRTEDFQDNGLAVVTVGDKEGLIDAIGKYIVEPKYDYINKFSEGLATAYNTAQGYAVIDEKGNQIFHTEQYISSFQDGRALFVRIVSDRWLYGYIDRQGKVAIEPKYKSATDFKNGKAVVQLYDGGYALIGKDGETMVKYKHEYVGELGEGMIAFKEKVDGKFGYMDERGKVVISPKFTGVETFIDGRAVVNTGEGFPVKMGMIDKKGKFIIKPEYNDVQILGWGMAAVGMAIDNINPFIGSRYAIADINGKFLTDFIYYGVSRYNRGYASVYDKDETFFIDGKGKKDERLPVVKGTGYMTFSDGLIKADVDNRLSYFTRDGARVWVTNTDIPLNSRYSVKELKYNPNRNYLVYYPQVSGMENKQLQDSVNERIKEIAIPDKVDGSTQLDYSYDGDFSVKFYNKDLLVLEFTGYNYPFGAAHGMPSKIYAHLDLKSGKFYGLGDLFKKNSNYTKRLSDIVKAQIEEQGADSYVWMDSYKGIKEDQPFFITKEALNLYFYPYEIAPYAAGFPTFTIPYKEIRDMINTEGAFWKSFN